MESIENKNIIFLRLNKNEDIIKQIKIACKIYNVKTAIVISGIGQIKNVQLGYFKEKGNYTKEIFNKPLEILSLNGNICYDNGEYTIHIHVVLGDEKKNAFGGHFFEGIVSVTAEIVLLKTSVDIKRKYDEELPDSKRNRIFPDLLGHPANPFRNKSYYRKGNGYQGSPLQSRKKPNPMQRSRLSRVNSASKGLSPFRFHNLRLRYVLYLLNNQLIRLHFQIHSSSISMKKYQSPPG